MNEEPHENIPQVEIVGSCESCHGIIQKCELNEGNFTLCDKCNLQICEKCIVECEVCKTKGCKKCFAEIEVDDYVCGADCTDGLLIIIAKEELIAVAEAELDAIKSMFEGYRPTRARCAIDGAKRIIKAIKGEVK